MARDVIKPDVERTWSKMRAFTSRVLRSGPAKIRLWRATSVLLLATVTSSACKDLTKDPGLPAGTPDPVFYNTADGARGLRTGAIANLEQAIVHYIVDSGLLSDELVDRDVGSTVSQSNSVIPDPLDERVLTEGVAPYFGIDGADVYYQLQTVRGTANLALGALAAYDTAAADLPAQRVMRGELYAFQGYAEILLAELFCSGVPLSTLDFRHDFTYQPSATTSQVYVDAMTKMDSALMLAAGNDSLVNLTRVLKGRAQLELGRYTAAADDVSSVPTTYRYRLMIPAYLLIGASGDFNQLGTVADQEGTNGLPFLSGGDSRTVTTETCHFPGFRCPNVSLTMPAKYVGAGVQTGAGYAPFAVGDGIEARLIEAEVALQAGNMTGWLATLNHLRDSAAILGLPSALSDTSDPGTAAARVALTFHERAYWLFMTGHRQGDLRRLIRQYGSQSQYPQFRSDQQVYPTGVYPAPGLGRYGTDVTVPIPTTEYSNPYFHGCLDRSA